jgi:perosamine synthetase
MSNVEAAIGCGQMERIADLVAAKRRILAAYRERLAGLPVRMNPEPPGTVNGAWMPTVVVDEGVPFDRERLLAEFKAADIDGRVFFWPLSGLAVPARVGPGGTPVAAAIHRRAVNLPSYHDLDDAGIDRVCEVLTHHLGVHRNRRVAAA